MDIYGKVGVVGGMIEWVWSAIRESRESKVERVKRNKGEKG